MYPIDLTGKYAMIFGVANHKSIAWAIAKTLKEAGASLIITYQNERLKERVEKLCENWNDVLLLECDVTEDENIAEVFEKVKEKTSALSILVHSIAFALREDLGGDFSATSKEGFRTALDISAYSLIPITRYAAPLMKHNQGSIIALTFIASERVFPGYNIMGTAKAALENEVKQLSSEFGQAGIRVNALSSGPLDTLAARGIHGFLDMKHGYSERAPLRRNNTHEEVAKAALFLSSDLASGITGVILPVDAGYHIMAV
jgi:enoyl-[acyl-carrier protein] reductase I